MLPYTLQPPRHPFLPFPPPLARPRFRPHSRAKPARTRRSRYSRYVPARNSFHLADKASLPRSPPFPSAGVNFSRSRPRRKCGSRDKIKISHAFVFFFPLRQRFDLALDKYCDIIAGAPKIELFRAARRAAPRHVASRRKRDRGFFNFRVNATRRRGKDRRERHGARIYVQARIQLGNIISSRITTGLIIVARAAAILVSISAISGTPGAQRMARQYE